MIGLDTNKLRQWLFLTLSYMKTAIIGDHDKVIMNV